jgi:hypothetical protein
VDRCLIEGEQGRRVEMEIEIEIEIEIEMHIECILNAYQV